MQAWISSSNQPKLYMISWDHTFLNIMCPYRSSKESDINDSPSEIEPFKDSVWESRALRDDLVDPPFTESLDFLRRDLTEPSWEILEDSFDLREGFGFPLELEEPRRDRSFAGDSKLFERSLDDFGYLGISRDRVESACTLTSSR